jgi:mannose-6-phosphate isomerase-like protein (cupin superfamily)
MRLKIDGADTADALTFYEYVSEPGVTGPPQHIHHGHDETFYVVDGTYEFTFGTEQVSAEPGAFLYVPRGRPHTFRNAGHGLGRIVGTFAPARFAEYFRELAEISNAPAGRRIERSGPSFTAATTPPSSTRLSVAPCLRRRAGRRPSSSPPEQPR